jgi:hypothetical protein
MGEHDAPRETSLVPQAKVTLAALAAALTSVGLAVVRHQAVDEAAVQTIVLAVLTFAAGYLGPRTSR